MAQQGWNLIQSADVSKKQGDKDSLFFESVAQAHGVMDVGAVDMFGMSFNSTDKIRVVDAGTDVVTAVREAIQLQWKAGYVQQMDSPRGRVTLIVDKASGECEFFAEQLADRFFSLLNCFSLSSIKREEFSQGAMEFKLSGYPFVADAAEAVYSRMMLSQILANLRALGYKLYASVDISMGHDGMDVESWVFRRVGPAWA